MLYKSFIAGAIGCIFFEKLYEVIQILIEGDVPAQFNVGTIGTIGFFVFLFSANYGTFDSILDDGSPELKKYRIIALAAPLVILIAGVFIIINGINTSSKIFGFLEELAICATIYYNFKHLIIPKEYSHIFSSMRLYFFLVILVSVIMTVENIGFYCGFNNIISEICVCASAVVIILMVPALELGVRKWRT